MSYLAAGLLLGAFALAAILVLPVARRTGLGAWHPAAAWLALEAVFFGLGSIVMAIDGRPGPALYVAGCVLAFALGVALSDRLARHRAPELPTARSVLGDPRDPAPLRPPVVVGLAALGLLLVSPTLVRVGLPFLAGDITGARSELAGLPVQELRVALPALALAIFLVIPRLRDERRVLAFVTIGAILAFELILASRYLAAELVAVLVIGAGLARRHVPVRSLAVIAIASVLAFGGIQVLRAYDQAAGRELAFAVERTVGRVAFIQPRTLEALQAAIPAEQPHFAGLTWMRRLGPLLGRPDIPNLGYWIYPRMFPEQTTVGYAAPGIIGEAWANFGTAGFALLALLGIGAERLGALIGRRRVGYGDVIGGALAILFLARTHALGLNGVAVLLVTVAAWRLLAAGGLRELGADVRAMLAWRT